MTTPDFEQNLQPPSHSKLVSQFHYILYLRRQVQKDLLPTMLPSQSQPDATGRGLLSGDVRLIMKIALKIGLCKSIIFFWNTLCNSFKHYGHGLGIKQEAVPLDIAICLVDSLPS